MNVTVEMLRTKGYPVAALKEPASVMLAAQTVQLSYFPTGTDFTELEDVVCALTFALLLKRTVAITRFGSVQKLDGYSLKMENDKIMSEVRSYAKPYYAPYYETIRQTGFQCMDVIGIYDNLFIKI